MFLTYKVGVDGKLLSKNSLSPKILECLTALQLMPLFFASCKAQSSWGFIVTMRMRPIALPVSWVIISEGWPSSASRISMFFLFDWAVDSKFSPMWAHFSKQLDSGYPTIVSLDMVIQCNVITPRLLLPCKSWNVSEECSVPDLANISQAIVHLFFCHHWLDIPSHVVCPFLQQTHCLKFPVPTCLY